MKFKRGDILKITYARNIDFFVRMTHYRYEPVHKKYRIYGVYLTGIFEGGHDNFLAYSKIDKLSRDELMVEML